LTSSSGVFAGKSLPVTIISGEMKAPATGLKLVSGSMPILGCSSLAMSKALSPIISV
jgi:hypothetical protein